MRILLVHNEYGGFSGEEAVVYMIQRLLEEHGHEAIMFIRRSADIPKMHFGRIRAFYSGIYSISSERNVQRLLSEHKPDIVHIHNLYPLISPSILPVCRKAGVPIIMTVHNYRLVCPNGLFMNRGIVCEKCRDGREYNCLLHNCEGNIFKSLGYNLRNYAARKYGLYRNNVSIFACLTKFQKQKMVEAGFEADKITIIPNMVDGKDLVPSESISDYVAYVGRVSPEKGIDTLRKAAGLLKDISFKVAGAFDSMSPLVCEPPNNLQFLDQLDRSRLTSFYDTCRFLILPSVCFEGLPLVLPEAMLHGKPVICSRIGGLPEIVDDGVTGLLFEPGNADDLAEKVRYLWDRPHLCRKMGQAGREKALREYSPKRYYERLMMVYEKALSAIPKIRIMMIPSEKNEVKSLGAKLPQKKSTK